MRIEFNEGTHTYVVGGEIVPLSVTELLHKHGLAPSYKGVSKSILEERARVGKEVHKDLENVLNTADYEPKTEQGRQFYAWVKKNVDCGVGEQMLGYDDGFLLAGTADVIGILKDGSFFIADHKNTSVFQEEYVSWQVSILDFMARQIGTRDVNGIPLNWKGASKFYCLKYDPKTGDLSVKELQKVTDDEILKLFEAEKEDRLYQRPLLVVDKELQLKFEAAERFLVEKENEFKKAEAEAKELRKQLCGLFESQNVKSWETGNIKVTYIPSVERVAVDSAKLKKSYPLAFSECQKISKVNASVRITIKENEDE